MARTLFAWTLHPIVYFWLIPSYTAFYCLVPKQAGGFLFSDEMARAAFILLVVFSLPIGFHHLYMDPEQGHGWKLLHAVGTFVVTLPTFITGFTVIASLEIAGRLNGGKGLFGWIAALPWSNPLVLALILGLLMLIFGGFGGLINASYAMNAMVHNTAWISGHFHLIFGGTTVIMYFGIAYYFWPVLSGKPLYCPSLAIAQLWSWFIGMIIMTTPWHILGLLGQPRRIDSVHYNNLLTLSWEPYEVTMIFGGLILLGSAGLLVISCIKPRLAGKLSRRDRVRRTDPCRERSTQLSEQLWLVERHHRRIHVDCLRLSDSAILLDGNLWFRQMGGLIMKKLILTTALLLPTALAAQPSSQVAWTADQLNFVKAGNPQKGQELAKNCGGCHGESGISTMPGTPSLAGQLPTYLYKQLRDYADGSRDNPMMSGPAKSLSKQDAADLAAWFSSRPPAFKSRSPMVYEQAEKLVTQGSNDRILPPCECATAVTARARKWIRRPWPAKMPSILSLP